MNRIHQLGAVGLVVTVELAATSGAASAPAMGSRLAADSALPSSKIAFLSKRDGNYEIYVMNADGSGQRRLTRDAALDLSPVWSPDGRKIAFVRFRDGNADVYVMNGDGSGQRRLARGVRRGHRTRVSQAIAFAAPSPAWSPDGRRIAFVSNRDGNFEVYVMNADGSGQRNLTRSPANEGLFAWSPGRKRGT